MTVLLSEVFCKIILMGYIIVLAPKQTARDYRFLY